ncbi:MAG: DM13 domain-containing protein [Boseongicola sp.]
MGLKALQKIAMLTVAFAFLSGPAVAQVVLYKGTFKGAGGKKSSGNFEIFKKDGKTLIRLKSNFRLSSVPDPKLAFGNGRYKKGTIYAKLKKFRGEQTYVIPGRLNAASFSQVWIWCEKFSVPLAVANIKKQ